MKKFLFICLLIVGFISWIPFQELNQNESAPICGQPNTTFLSGEVIGMHIYYSVIGVYINAGSATFSVSSSNYEGHSVYHMVGYGQSNSKYDWIFKVRDRYESYVDQNTMLPIKFIRDVHEGKYARNQTANFDRATKLAKTSYGNFHITSCTQDVISAVYNIRNVNFDHYKVNDKISFDMFLGEDLYHMYVRYMGKEIIKTRLGSFHAIKIKPLLLKGNTFKGGEKMTAWISDDANRIPLRIESPLSVGSIKVDMMTYKNLRHPFSARIN